MVGKTCLAKAFVGDQFPDRYVATVTGNYTGSVAAYGDQYTVDIRDTNGQVSIYWYAFFLNMQLHCAYFKKVIFICIYHNRKLNKLHGVA